MGNPLPPLPGDEILIQTPDVFTEIIAGRSPASFVYRDELVTAFMDIRPITPGHVLVVPNEPARFLHELTANSAGHLFLVGCRIAEALRRSTLRCEGVNMLVADGVVAGQEIPHVHLHIFPRFPGDGFDFSFAEGYGQLPPREALDDAAARIRQGLDSVTSPLS